MERKNYTDFAGGFDQVLLEESFVLNMKTTMSFVEFQMNFAITENYPLYTPPPEEVEQPQEDDEEDFVEEDCHYDDYFKSSDDTDNSEANTETENTSNSDSSAPISEEETVRYSYRKGRIFFPNMEQVKWESRIQPYIDPASGGVDYGAIDYFYEEGGFYYLAGYWGELILSSGEPLLEIDEWLDYNKK